MKVTGGTIFKRRISALEPPWWYIISPPFTEEGWFRYAVLREYDKWPQFPHTDYPTVESIKSFLHEVHERTNAYLETIDADDLDRQLSLALGFDASLRYVIWHVLEHEIHHRGEIFLMLGLQGMEAPDV